MAGVAGECSRSGEAHRGLLALYEQALLELDLDTAAGGVFDGLLGLFADEVFLETVSEG